MSSPVSPPDQGSPTSANEVEASSSHNTPRRPRRLPRDVWLMVMQSLSTEVPRAGNATEQTTKRWIDSDVCSLGALARMARVCREWGAFATEVLYRDVRLHSRLALVRFARTMELHHRAQRGDPERRLSYRVRTLTFCRVALQNVESRNAARAEELRRGEEAVLEAVAACGRGGEDEPLAKWARETVEHFYPRLEPAAVLLIRKLPRLETLSIVPVTGFGCEFGAAREPPHLLYLLGSAARYDDQRRKEDETAGRERGSSSRVPSIREVRICPPGYADRPGGPSRLDLVVHALRLPGLRRLEVYRDQGPWAPGRTLARMTPRYCFPWLRDLRLMESGLAPDELAHLLTWLPNLQILVFSLAQPLSAEVWPPRRQQRPSPRRVEGYSRVFSRRRVRRAHEPDSDDEKGPQGSILTHPMYFAPEGTRIPSRGVPPSVAELHLDMRLGWRMVNQLRQTVASELFERSEEGKAEATAAAAEEEESALEDDSPEAEKKRADERRPRRVLNNLASLTEVRRFTVRLECLMEAGRELAAVPLAALLPPNAEEVRLVGPTHIAYERMTRPVAARSAHQPHDHIVGLDSDDESWRMLHRERVWVSYFAHSSPRALRAYEYDVDESNFAVGYRAPPRNLGRPHGAAGLTDVESDEVECLARFARERRGSMRSLRRVVLVVTDMHRVAECRTSVAREAEVRYRPAVERAYEDLRALFRDEGGVEFEVVPYSTMERDRGWVAADVSGRVFRDE